MTPDESGDAISSDATPGQIEVWVCPACGDFAPYRGEGYRYCRSTGACVTHIARGTTSTDMVVCAYIYLGEFDPDA